MLLKKKLTLNKLITYVQSIPEVKCDSNNVPKIVIAQNNQNQSHGSQQLNQLTQSIKQPQSLQPTEQHKMKFKESKNINDLPCLLKKLFDPFIKNFVRYGSRNEGGISLYFSLLALLIDGFYEMDESKQDRYIAKFREKLVSYAISCNYNYLKWSQQSIVDSICKFKNNKIVLKIIADCFCLNVFLLNIVNDKIFVISNVDYYDMFRSCIFLVLDENVYEPLFFNKKGILEYDCDPLKKLINVDRGKLLLVDISFGKGGFKNFEIKFDEITIANEESNAINIDSNNDNSCNHINEMENDNISNVKNDDNDVNNNNDKKDDSDSTIVNNSDNNTNDSNNTNINDNQTNDNHNDENHDKNNEYDSSDDEDKLENGFAEISPTDSDVNVFRERKKIISSKMKLDEIQKIAESYGISLFKLNSSKTKNKKKTKNELIEEIENID